jgi:hypothetical protein
VIDILTLALTHGLMALAALILVTRGDLDDEETASAATPRWRQRTDPGAAQED